MDTLISICCFALRCRYLIIGRIFLRADLCFRTAWKPLIDSQGRNLRSVSLRSRFPIRASSMASPCFRRSDALNRGYLGKSRPFPRADSCYWTAQTPLIDGLGRNRSATRGWAAKFESGPPLLLERRSDICGYLGIDQPSLRAVLSIWMEISCLTRCMGNLIGSLKIKETDFVVSTLHSDCPLLILKTFETLKISRSWFNFFLNGMSYNTYIISRVQCWLLANDRACWHGSNYLIFLFFPLAR